MGGKSKTPPPPDYGPMREASDKAAQLGKELGQEQIAESKRQYDESLKFSKPIAEAQKGLMDESLKQGKDYYEYGKKGRPVEEALTAESLKDVSARDLAEREAMLGSNAEIEKGRYGEDIRQQVDTAVGDARQGTTAQMNQLIRQGARYGYSPEAMSAHFGRAAATSGLGAAGSANAARMAALTNARSMLSQGRSMRQQDDAIGWARKLDVAGLYRGMPGAAQGSYGLALGSGSSAMQAQAAPGAALLSGMNQGAGIQQKGAGQQLQGLGATLGSQTTLHSQGLQLEAQQSAGVGQAIGAAAGAASTAYGAYSAGAAKKP